MKWIISAVATVWTVLGVIKFIEGELDKSIAVLIGAGLLYVIGCVVLIQDIREKKKKRGKRRKKKQKRRNGKRRKQ